MRVGVSTEYERALSLCFSVLTLTLTLKLVLGLKIQSYYLKRKALFSNCQYLYFIKDNNMNCVVGSIQQYEHLKKPVFSQVLGTHNTAAIDLSIGNRELQHIDVGNCDELSRYIQSKLQKGNLFAGIGGYLEDRAIYRRSSHFGVGEHCRSIHLGIDVWCEAGSVVHTPLPASVHSFRINNNFGDYGPTIILQHRLDQCVFYSLYGHLETKSLQGKAEGMVLAAGEAFATVGMPHENGNYPPHLHFQLIADMQHYSGDFPGVCAPVDLACYRELCPNPECLLMP